MTIIPRRPCQRAHSWEPEFSDKALREPRLREATPAGAQGVANACGSQEKQTPNYHTAAELNSRDAARASSAAAPKGGFHCRHGTR